jgi:hypothetical protein
MSSRAIVQNMTRLAVGLFTATWQARVRTSAANGTNPTFGAWADREMHATSRTSSEEWDDDRDSWMRIERRTVRESDSYALLTRGDQLKDPDGTIWAIHELTASGPGSRQYAVIITHPVAQTRQNGPRP